MTCFQFVLFVKGIVFIKTFTADREIWDLYFTEGEEK